MTLKQMLEAMLYVVPIMAVIILVLWLIIRNQNKKKDALEAAMTQEQKDRLLQTRPEAAPAGKGGFVTEALVVEKLDKGAKYGVRLTVPRYIFNTIGFPSPTFSTCAAGTP